MDYTSDDACEMVPQTVGKLKEALSGVDDDTPLVLCSINNDTLWKDIFFHYVESRRHGEIVKVFRIVY